MIADEPLADRLDDRDAAGHRRLEKHRHLVRVAASKISLPCSASSALLPVTTIFPRSMAPRISRRLSSLLAHQLDDDLHRRIVEQILPARGQQFRGNHDAAIRASCRARRSSSPRARSRAAPGAGRDFCVRCLKTPAPTLPRPASPTPNCCMVSKGADYRVAAKRGKGPLIPAL